MMRKVLMLKTHVLCFNVDLIAFGLNNILLINTNTCKDKCSITG